MTDRTTEEAKREAFKLGNEFAPYHPAASHVEPGYRDGWNACYRAALQWQAEQQKGEARKPDDEVVRYCPECGLIGPVKDGHHTCCPDSFGMSVRRWQAEKMERILDRLRAASPHVVPPGHVLVPVEVVEFLKGAAALDGAWFGERHRTERGAFWWRKRLSSLPQAPQGEQPCEGTNCKKVRQDQEHSTECIEETAKSQGWDAMVSREYFTVVFKFLNSDEARDLMEHPKGAAFSWSHAIRERNAAEDRAYPKPLAQGDSNE